MSMNIYFSVFFFLMILLPPSSPRTDTLFPSTTLFRSVECLEGDHRISGVRLVDGSVIPADLAIVGIGIDPAVAPASTAWRSTRNTAPARSEEHTSELQSLMRISYAVFCLKKKTTQERKYRKEHTTMIHTNKTQTR